MPVSKKNQNLPKLWQSIKPQQSVRQFENSVIQFHNNHRTAVRQLPYVLGKRINLRKLYISVIKRGGYKRVNENSDWEDVLDELNLPRETINCELAIQSIYHRYLEEYEREQWTALGSGAFLDGFSVMTGAAAVASAINIGNNPGTSNSNTNNNGSGGPDTDNIDLSKHSQLISELAVRDKSFLAAFVNDNTPKTFCDYQHIINNSVRSESGLSCDIRELHEFSGLTLSLLSGLANEIEFALNTLLIISNSHQIRFDLRFTGNLIDVMLATVGVFESVSCSYYEQFRNCGWMKRTLQFWNDTVTDGIGRIFLIPNIFTIPKSEIKALLKSNSLRSNPLDGSSPLFNNDDQHHEITDPYAHRVHLVATVLYNLTNDSLSNSRSIVSNFQFLRFLFLSIHSMDPVLRRLSLHILSKLRFVLYPINSSRNLEKSLFDGHEKSVDLDANEDEDDSEGEWFSQFLLELVQSLLSSENRCDRIAALEMIQTLCLIEENHQILNKSFQPSFVATISSQLLIPDIHPLCCTLESLVSLSQLGEDMCRRMAMCQALLKILLQFIQIEAQMFGPSAVYKIKTFNHRPPIPMPTYHSLPQIMRFPSSNPLRQPFVNPLPSTSINNFVESNLQHQNPNSITLPLVSVANNYNSISTQGLSKIPLQNNIAKPHSMLHHSHMLVHNNYNNLSNSNSNNSSNSNCNINNNNSTISTFNHMPNPQLYKASQQLTPLQQIDQLLTKSIASFENPSMKKDELNEEEKVKIEEEKEKETTNKVYNNGTENCEEIKTFTVNAEKVVNVEKKVVKIKCGIDGPDCEIEEINGSNKFDKEINGLKSDSTNLSKISTPKLVNGAEVDTQSTFNDIDEAKVTNKSEKPVYMNGILEIDATTFDDPDRRQMPPPSLPTPSMLKKQMRPKLSPPSQVGVANGYLQQLNSKVKRKLVSEMTLTTNAQIEDRCDRAKSWLRQRYRLSDDSKLFVLKQDLVNDLHEFLFEDDNEESQGQASRRIFSAHELHSCIKDVFGSKVQVKVEHKLNGSSQLIYSNLCRIHDEDSNKTPPNGIINPAFMEMNGFLHHSIHKKRLKLNNNSEENDKIDKQIKRKHRKHLDDLDFSNQKEIHTTIEQMKKKCSYRNRKKVNCLISKAQRKLLLAKKTNLKASLKLKFMNSKLSQDENKIYASASSASTSNPSILTSQIMSPKTNENYPIETYLPVMCLWGSCTERFSDENSLHFHLTNSHIPMSTANNMSMSRINCQWQHCFTASVPRAPLSLLSHVLQEHCYKPHISTVPPQNMSQKLMNPMPYNIASPPSVNSIVPNSSTASNVLGQISEKSGWSVLHDHFRLDEQMQPHLPEGPITKHIRISSSIILRNMSRHSIITKEFLKNNESLLSTVAMSNQDCAPIIIQCLDELKLPTVNDS